MEAVDEYCINLLKGKIKYSSWKFISLIDVICWVNFKGLAFTSTVVHLNSLRICLSAALPCFKWMYHYRSADSSPWYSRSSKWKVRRSFFPRLVWRIQNITTSSDRRPHKSSKAYRTKGIAWCWGAADAKGFNFSNDKSLHSKSRVVGCRLSARVRSGDGSIINTVWVKPMTCLSCYSQLSDLSRKNIKRKMWVESKALWVGTGRWRPLWGMSTSLSRVLYCSVFSY